MRDWLENRRIRAASARFQRECEEKRKLEEKLNTLKEIAQDPHKFAIWMLQVEIALDAAGSSVEDSSILAMATGIGVGIAISS